ncbi:hypothetical protein KPL40_18495 [Clostridium gasigenes]|uniref:YobI family P-loop NTPase n=1 Tax=Clostridium gasigenes TaxID=94869 RepID=UPI001C0D955F|nr:hypothetical protein [Clostridium gasigenes]MBU3134406.1 hypothetical protein [Clostridium gasigenes]
MRRVKKLLLKYIEKIEEWCKREDIDLIESSSDLPLVDLAPNGDSEMTLRYIDYIKHALRNRNVYNIALSGIYGSGKSSILENLKSDERESMEFKYLDISLANFNLRKPKSDELEDNLEKAIVKQILYSGDRKKRPQSRFKGIINVDDKKYKLKSVLLIAVVLFYLFIFKSEFVIKNITTLYNIFNKISINRFWVVLLFIVTLAIALTGAIVILNYILRYTHINLKLNKVKIFNNELQSIEETRGSSFNQYIDEILYFFEVNDYNVVIFEDLDRFDNIEIFTKLRELNKLLRASSNIDKQIKFIYAIKDDLFFEKVSDTEIDCSNAHKNRTKFFDFIIPVIPIVNHSNSVELIKNRLNDIDEELVKKISLKFIKKLSFYIDDMRLLNNIINEFYIYSKGLSTLAENKLFEDKKLFAMITYKNLYPNDFAKLQVKQGVLYEIFNNKNILKEELIKDTKNQIDEINKILEMIESTFLKCKSELVKVYCANIVSRLHGKYKIYLNTDWINFLEITSVEFEKIINGSEDKYEFRDYNGYNEMVNISSIKNAFNTLQDYNSSVNLKYNEVGSKKQEWINKKSQLEKIKKEILGMRIEKILKESDVYLEVNYYKDLANNSLLMFLLKEGHIDESYNDYLTYFYPGSLSEEEKLFVKSVFADDKTGLDIELNNIDNILEEIFSDDFKKDSILNPNLILHIISNKTKYYSEVINKLIDNSSASKNFIINNIEILSNRSIGIIDLAKQWDDFWRFIYHSDIAEDNIKKVTFVNLIKNLENNRIKTLNKDNLIDVYFENIHDFLAIDLEEKEDKIEELLIDLNIRFKLLDFNNSNNNKLQQFIIKNKLYRINTEMLSNILRIYGIESINYTNIIDSGESYLLEYIEENIQVFVKEVYLTLSNDVYEDSENILKILNNEKLQDDTLNSIIDKIGFEISEIDKVENKSLWRNIFIKEKVALNWNNLLCYYEEYSLDSILTKVFNTDEAITNITNEMLSDIKRSKKMKLDEDIIYSEEIEDKFVIKLIDAFGFTYTSLNLESINSNRVKVLVNKNIINFNNKNFKALIKDHHNFFIEYILNNLEGFISNIDEYSLSGQDVIKLLRDIRIDERNRSELINKFTVQTYIDTGITEDVITIINDIENNIDISQEFILELISKSKNLNSNLNLLNNYWQVVKSIDKYYIEESLKNSLTKDNIKNINGKWISNESLINILLQLISDSNIIETLDINIMKQLFGKTNEDNIRVKVIIELLSRCLTDNIYELISTLNSPYSDISAIGNQLKLEYTEQNLQLVDKLKEKKLISSFVTTDDSIKIYLFRNNEALKKRELIKR